MTVIFSEPTPMTIKGGTEYATQIVAGEIHCCETIRLAAKRFLSDLERTDWEWEFDEERGQDILDFCSVLKFTEGDDIAGTYIQIQPWMAFAMMQVFGWRSKTDPSIRRFKTLIWFIARKNWKTGLTALINLYELINSPPNSQIYSTAPGYKQSMISFKAGKDLIGTLHTSIQHKFRIITDQITYLPTGSYWRPCADNPRKQDGYNPRAVIYDESAAITKREVIEVMTSGQGSQKSPLNIHITTGSFSRETYFYELLSYSKDMLRGIAEMNDELLACIYEVDDYDKWDDLEELKKANPNYGLSVRESFIGGELKKAKAIPTTAQEFKIKNCNMFVSSSASWLSIDCLADPEAILPKLITTGDCYIAIDLGLTDDLAAVQVSFPQPSGDVHTIPYAFLPEDTLERAHAHIQPIYREAMKDRTLVRTEGDVTDPNAIISFITKLMGLYNVVDIAYDPKDMTLIATELSERGFPIHPFIQAPKAMSPATQETMALLMKRGIKTTGSRFLQWQLGNCEAKSYLDDEIVKIIKGPDRANKIDNMIALIMTVGRITERAAVRPIKKGYAFR